ncbi:MULTISPECIES: metallophosphoesterase [Paenibacillus]|uniref:Phosphoesterase n=1 Tax=Paenibacillus violae TaxID=3077234 RepID=A0ABU3R7Q4_9BACL|nr:MULTISPECIES: metallophosphoesterase [Paenibacillus]MDU0200300.1 metallophosphoesterase [Paenibacillus sp. PFR10]MEC0265903.1 metallophosphoesterase [Paenibacillus anseongense]
MRIGVISDTHLSARVLKLPDALIAGLKGVDLILHAGDWVSEHVVDLVEQIAPCEAVAGNNDGHDIIERFGLKKIVTAGKYRIGLIHGDGFRKTTEERAREAFREEQPDIVIFGHSHIPYHQTVDGIVMFNPGSPTDKRRQPQYSYGIIELSDRILAQHYFYESKA